MLREIDRVIRRGGTARNFITLVLLRLDPRTGEVLLSNAGHPYPFLVTPGEVTTVSKLDLPGLPLGQGPAREYRNHVFQLPPGGALIICSDGLIESRDWREEPYGFDRPRDVLLGAAHASAGGIPRRPPRRLAASPRQGGAAGRYDGGGGEADRRRHAERNSPLI